MSKSPNRSLKRPLAAEVEEFRDGDLVEVFYRMPYGEDNGRENLDFLGSRWLLCPTPLLGTNRPRIGWSERWLPATVVADDHITTCAKGTVSVRWDVLLWYDWASGERRDALGDRGALLDSVPLFRVRHRSRSWNVDSSRRLGLPSPGVGHGLHASSELQIGGVSVAVSFIVFRWGAAKIPIQYDTHSWGRAEGSTVSARFIKLFFFKAVVPILGSNYEVLSVFIQHSDEFASMSPEFLASLCRGKCVVALYFLWPIQGQQTYGDKTECTAAYVDAVPFFDMVSRMEVAGIPTRWPHHSQLWKILSSKDWVPNLCVAPKFHIPLTTRVPKSLILCDPTRCARDALRALWLLQEERRGDNPHDATFYPPRSSDWNDADQGKERCCVKLGYSYEGIDVQMVQGERDLAAALYQLATQPSYKNDCVYVQQRVRHVDLEARCFVVRGSLISVLYTRFARIDDCGHVRDYEKAQTADEAVRDWFYGDHVAWEKAMTQIQALTRRWNLWLLTQAAEPTASVRIDYMLERVAPGEAEVWTGEVGEQGYSMGGVDPVAVFNAVLDQVSEELVPHQAFPSFAEDGSLGMEAREDTDVKRDV